MLRALPGVARANAAGAAVTRELVPVLVADGELDVRIAIALQAASLVDGLGAAFVASAVLPTLDTLVRDEAIGARVELAPFGFDMGPYAVESQWSRFVDPALAVARTAVRDGLKCRGASPNFFGPRDWREVTRRSRPEI